MTEPNNDVDEQHRNGIDQRGLLYALDRLALGFESADAHIRHEAKMVARQNISQISHECDMQAGTNQDE